MASSPFIKIRLGVLLIGRPPYAILEETGQLHRKTFRKSLRSFSCFNLKHKFQLLRHARIQSRIHNQLWCSSASDKEQGCEIHYEKSLPVLTVPLPSRRELCSFPLKPMSNTVADLMQFIQNEDLGVDHLAIYNKDSVRIAKSTPIELLLRDDFQIVINDKRYFIRPPVSNMLPTEQSQSLDQVKEQVAHLYTVLHVEHYQMSREKELLKQLEEITTQLQPLEETKKQLDLKAHKHTSRLTYVGLGLMGIQFGLFARLTWWEYSWDIMEPVTYFATYAAVSAMFAYFVVTKQEYSFPDARNRQHLFKFYKNAGKVKFDLDRYNQLRDLHYKATEDLMRLRDPLQVHLPIVHLEKKPLLPKVPSPSELLSSAVPPSPRSK